MVSAPLNHAAAWLSGCCRVRSFPYAGRVTVSDTSCPVDWSQYRAVLFDLDGVLTPTAEIHMRAWSETFNPLLRAAGHERPYTDADYFAFVDGKPRLEGVASLLESRGIELPAGDPGDGGQVEQETIVGVGMRKNAVFTQILHRDGIAPYPGSLALLDYLAGTDLALAVVSSSRNAVDVLAAAGLTDRFPVVMDGNRAATLGLPGKPRPDTFLYAAGAVGADPGAAIVVEDAVSGVRAGAAGGFGLVIGVDRGVGTDTLTEAGAALVIDDLADLIPRE